MEDNQNKKKSNPIYTVLMITVLVSLLWGVPSMIHGKGFLNGIIENIEALINFIILIIVGYVIYKIFSK
ncbi:hypothetical protein GCM10022386_01390 [Flavobacterium cheonhonense]|uniref:Uncharacterized protein n=1 Tax=Flavobacterium cheonhonense TaxID=706185 RepID=A0ABP7T7R1_9FLAO|nr:hypothetical protein [Flavobacterium cheonhonense]